ncbi:MAG: endonuclease/exonuclease/phosphatase family protein [Balneolaceae bacterium]|nr:endonuclease/exonuclease/phosphatase family protein [Balneolaceae bacterium]MBO6649174.1 endonuclease/exonuclease/phosphatase family protein [Balneolaceae bacterium]
MMKKQLLVTLLFLCFITSSVSAQSTSELITDGKIRLVTWNIEHLAENNGEGCVARDESDYVKLRNFAATMDADVVALQEVESVKAVARVFPENEWDIILSDRPDSGSYECRGTGRPSTQQKVAFAIRKGVEFENMGSFDELAIGNPGLRYGLIIKLKGASEPIEVMNIHLKSGCFVNDYSASDRAACETFERQVPVLDKWVEQKVKEETPFVILGDYNNRITTPDNHFWQDLEDMDGNQISIRSSMENVRGCHPRYPDPIDHILLGPKSSKLLVESSQDVYYFGMTPETMTEDDMLSDHCPISVDLWSTEPYPVSTAVRWTQNSAEYKLITENLYNIAVEILAEMNICEPWVVIMDVDETILDNSEYNRRRDKLGLGYTPESWASWVREESATLVPGSSDFISNVMLAGGQIVLITNRDRTLDQHTWNNLEKLGLPITRTNTCLIGRSKEDIDAVGKSGIVNDKDLRRQNILNGEGESCWAEFPGAKSSWNTKFILVMEVGDNIKDFAKTTQENVNYEAFLKRQGKDILILPNAMYGSWD